MNSGGIKAKFEPLRDIFHTDIGAFYTPIGTPSAHPIRILRIFNDMNQDIKISFDDIDDFIFLQANHEVMYEFGANKVDSTGILEMPQGTQVYGRYLGMTPPTVGSVYVEMVYASTR